MCLCLSPFLSLWSALGLAWLRLGICLCLSPFPAHQCYLQRTSEYLHLCWWGNSLRLFYVFLTCTRRKLCRSSDMLQNTGGSGRFEHLRFSQHSGFFSGALKPSSPQNNEKRYTVCIFAHTLYTIQYNVFGLQQSHHTMYTT